MAILRDLTKQEADEIIKKAKEFKVQNFLDVRAFEDRDGIYEVIIEGIHQRSSIPNISMYIDTRNNVSINTTSGKFTGVMAVPTFVQGLLAAEKFAEYLRTKVL